MFELDFTNQVIGGANRLINADNTSTAELDIISEKVPLDDINTHETFSSVDVHPFVAGSAVQFLDESTTAGIDTSVSYFVGQIVAGQEYSLYLTANDATNDTNVVQLNDITSVSHLSIHGETLFGAAVNGLSNDVITVGNNSQELVKEYLSRAEMVHYLQPVLHMPQITLFQN